MINLRSFDEPSNPTLGGAGVGRFSQFSVPNFRVQGSFLGNIGEPLAFGGAAGGNEDDGDGEENNVELVDLNTSS